MLELASNDERVRLLKHRERQEEMKKDFGEYLSEDGEAEEDEWALRLDVDSKGRCLPTINNAKIILANDRALKGKIRKNEFTKKYRVFGETPWEKEKKERDWTDADDAGLRHYMEKIYQIKGKSTIEDAWTLVANENRYHPVRDYLNSLQWDGTERIRYALHHFLGADTDEYTFEALKLFMMGAIRRVFQPGSKFEVMLCLVGGQGAGKSTFFRLLAVKDEWFSDDLKKLDDENVYRKLQGHWIMEMSDREKADDY